MQQSWISLNSKETLKYLVGELNYNFSISNGFTQFVNFPTRLPDCDSHRTVTLTVWLFWIYLFLLMLVFVLQWLSLHWEILIMLLSQFPLTFHQIHNGMPRFIAWLMTIIIVLIETVFVIIWEMFHGRIFLNSVLLLLLLDFVSGFGIDVYTS